MISMLSSSNDYMGVTLPPITMVTEMKVTMGKTRMCQVVSSIDCCNGDYYKLIMM